MLNAMALKISEIFLVLYGFQMCVEETLMDCPYLIAFANDAIQLDNSLKH